jgi:hypothetical protein
MPCCGNGRRLLVQDAQAHPGTVRVNPAVYNTALFQYRGRTRLTAVGAATKTVYQFNGYGAQAIVDGRDVASLAAVPLLAKV